MQGEFGQGEEIRLQPCRPTEAGRCTDLAGKKQKTIKAVYSLINNTFLYKAMSQTIRETVQRK